MRPVWLQGTGLACALGRGREACVQTLRTGRPEPGVQVLDGLDPPLELSYYRIPDGRADLFDPARMAALVPAVVEEALSEAGLAEADCAGMPVFVGSSCFSIAEEERRYATELDRGAADAVPMLPRGFGVIAAMAQSAAGAGGPAYTWNTACTSAANALLAAQRSLALGRSDRALVVGVELANRTTLQGFSSLQLVADAVRPFDARREGIVLGEGISAAVLGVEPGPSRLPRIAGGASNCDTHAVTGSSPDGSSIADVLSAALRAVGAGAHDIRTLKVHGTGTVSNDASEAAGMHRVFSPLPPVTALKPWLGHTMGACGLNELVLYAGALRQGFVPGAPGCEVRDEACDIVPLAEHAGAEAGLHLLNQFGFGGNNTVLIVEQT